MTTLPTHITLSITASEDITEQEELQGYALTGVQVKLYSKLLADDLQEVADTRVVDGDHIGYSQTIAHLQGRISLLKYLLACAKAVNQSTSE